MIEVPKNIILGACNILDTIKSEWGDQWSDWNQSIRDGLSTALVSKGPMEMALKDLMAWKEVIRVNLMRLDPNYDHAKFDAEWDEKIESSAIRNLIPGDKP